MDKRIVLVGAGSTSFGPASLTDISLSKVLPGSTIVLHDIDGEKLEMIYELVLAENEKIGNHYTIERTTDRAKAFKDADFIISSIYRDHFCKMSNSRLFRDFFFSRSGRLKSVRIIADSRRQFSISS